jgi:hypothetical protein
MNHEFDDKDIKGVCIGEHGELLLEMNNARKSYWLTVSDVTAIAEEVGLELKEVV